MSKKTITVDFSDIKNLSTMKEGIQPAEITGVELKEGQKGPYINFVWESSSGVAYDNCSLSPKALWRLAKVLRAIGMDVPKDEMEIELDALVGEKATLHIEHEEYEGKPQARVIDLTPYEENGDDTDDDDNADDDNADDGVVETSDDEVDETELYDESDFKGLNSAELDMVIDEENLDEKMKSMKPVLKKRKAVIQALITAGLMETGGK